MSLVIVADACLLIGALPTTTCNLQPQPGTGTGTLKQLEPETVDGYLQCGVLHSYEQRKAHTGH
jgi:hypothetical protein